MASCPLCRLPLGDDVRLLACICGRGFHRGCINAHLAVARVCPLCRSDYQRGIPLRFAPPAEFPDASVTEVLARRLPPITGDKWTWVEGMGLEQFRSAHYLNCVRLLVLAAEMLADEISASSCTGERMHNLCMHLQSMMDRVGRFFMGHRLHIPAPPYVEGAIAAFDHVAKRVHGHMACSLRFVLALHFKRQNLKDSAVVALSTALETASEAQKREIQITIDEWNQDPYMRDSFFVCSFLR